MNSFVKGFGGVMLAYVILLPLSIFAYRSVDNAALKALIALAPVLPIALGLVVILRRIRGLDELERRIQLEAVVFAFGATAVLTFAYGLLEDVDFPRIDLTWILPFMTALWALGQAIARRRYS
jgi:hypothetical protein